MIGDLESPDDHEIHQLFRFPAIILEAIPATLALIFLVMDMRVSFTCSVLVMGFIYLFGSWYLFKPTQYTWYNFIATTFIAFFLLSILMGWGFYVSDWDGNKELQSGGYFAALYGSIATFIYAVVRTVVVENKKLELRMSWKLFSRFLFLLICYHIFGEVSY